MSEKIVLGYWAIRGLCQPIRLILEYAGVQYEEVRYVDGNPEDEKRWFEQDKPRLYNEGLAFPNLPYLIHGTTKLSQSHAIARFLARKYGLVPSTEEENILMDAAQNEIEDIRSRAVDLFYSSEHNTLKPKFLEKLPFYFERLEKFLNNKKWVAGDKLTFVDFQLYETLDVHSLFVPGLLESYPNLKSFHKRVQELPQIANYLKSSRCIVRPINGSEAAFK